MRTFPHANFNPFQMLKHLVIYCLHKGWLTDSINHSVMRENILKDAFCVFGHANSPL